MPLADWCHILDFHRMLCMAMQGCVCTGIRLCLAVLGCASPW